MELFPPLSDFFNAIEKDVRINTTHISLYMTLLQQWNLNGGNCPFEIKRHEIMKTAKINSRYTYNQCMNHLHESGYINYIPSANSSILSKVFIEPLK